MRLLCGQWAAGLALILALSACGGRVEETAPAPTQGPAATDGSTASAGQVALQVPRPAVSFHAASRLADQASFGPTPALVAEIRAKGFERWIDDQLALPPSQMDATPFLSFPDPIPSDHWNRWYAAFPTLVLSGPDQLRLRVTWALTQVLATSYGKGHPVGSLNWVNLLQRHALGRYDRLLVEATINPHMGYYLDNVQNRPKSAECTHCAPNENYARELMQLFTLGVFRLNADGTPQRNALGALIETYGQRDVEELARVLTGWQFDPLPANRPPRNNGNWLKPMVPSTWPPERDAGQKTVLGRTFPAGQAAPKDLDDAVELLMSHPNIAPFVATRLIQHLVKSDPSPAYVARVAARFGNNGSGVRGDLKAVVKAVLLDAEARAGDDPSVVAVDQGKFREPFLHRVALWRGLGCQQLPFTLERTNGFMPSIQRPLAPESVFSYYAPTDRAPGSNVLAPEQRLFVAREIRDRLTRLESALEADEKASADPRRFKDAGCEFDRFVAAYGTSPAAFSDLLSTRFFRGHMPPALRASIERVMLSPQHAFLRTEQARGTARMLSFALMSPAFGVIR